MQRSYPCPGCGFLVFDEPLGSYDICPLCDWEDDESQLRYPMSGGGANNESLCEHQQLWLRGVPITVQERRGYKRDPLWRPFQLEDYDVPDYFMGALEWFKVTDDDPPYYWRTADIVEICDARLRIPHKERHHQCPNKRTKLLLP